MFVTFSPALYYSSFKMSSSTVKYHAVFFQSHAGNTLCSPVFPEGFLKSFQELTDLGSVFHTELDPETLRTEGPDIFTLCQQTDRF